MKNLFGDSVFVIGEVAQAHDGSLGTAHAYIDLLAEIGANAVKFQTHYAQYESTLDEPWRVKFSFQDNTRYDYWKRMEFTKEQWIGLKKHAEEKNLIFMSSPFSLYAAQMLHSIGMKVWKIASGEVSDPWLLDFIISTNNPIIFSTGMSSLEKIDNYVDRLNRNGSQFGIVQCTSKYPSGPEDIGLNVMQDLKIRYGVPVGLSDHSGEIYPSLAAVSNGAEIIEAHICMNKKDFGPDVVASLDPVQFKDLVKGVRFIEKMLESPVDKDSLSETLSRSSSIFSKGVCARQSIKIGNVFTRENLCLKKPCINSIPAMQVNSIIGRKASREYQIDEFIDVKEIEK